MCRHCGAYVEYSPAAAVLAVSAGLTKMKAAHASEAEAILADLAPACLRAGVCASASSPSSPRTYRSQSSPTSCITRSTALGQFNGLLSHLAPDSGADQAAAAPNVSVPWQDLSDDIMKTVLSLLPPAYVRVARLVCKGWAGSGGRLLTRLKPEALQGPHLAATFPNLRVLDLSECNHTVDFHSTKQLRLRSRINDAELQFLVPLQPHLRELSLRGCVSLTGRPGSGFEHLASLSLTVLDLSHCEALEDAAVDVVGAIPTLRVLNLRGCHRLSTAALASLASKPGLRYLCLSSDLPLPGSSFSRQAVTMLARWRRLER